MEAADGPTTEKAFAEVRNAFELPNAFVATSANFPNVLAAIVLFSVADVPEGLRETAPIAMAGGKNAGKNANVDPAGLTPVTVTAMAVPVTGVNLAGST